jgi:hypothetical protein
MTAKPILVAHVYSFRSLVASRLYHILESSSSWIIEGYEIIPNRTNNRGVSQNISSHYTHSYLSLKSSELPSFPLWFEQERVAWFRSMLIWSANCIPSFILSFFDSSSIQCCLMIDTPRKAASIASSRRLIDFLMRCTRDDRFDDLPASSHETIPSRFFVADLSDRGLFCFVLFSKHGNHHGAATSRCSCLCVSFWGCASSSSVGGWRFRNQ